MAQKDSRQASRFGKNLSRLRNAEKLTQATLAEKAGIGIRHLQRIEKGEKTPGLSTLIALKSALRADWKEIFQGL